MILLRKLFLVLILFPLLLHAQDPQLVPYRGGQADGHHQALLSNYTLGNITMQGPYFGGSADGYAMDSSITFDSRGPALLFAPFAGGTADGYAVDSIINFNPRGYITMFSPFGGGFGDGYAFDSLISFNPRGYITMFGPFGGGLADGYHEAVICNYPKIDGDTTLFLKCSDDVANLNELVMNYNFAGRWNTANPTAAGPGNYELRINNAGKCLDTAVVIVKLDVVRWTGTVDNNWHNPANWNTGYIPTEVSHVIVSQATPHPCEIFEMDATAASVQAIGNAVIRTIGGRRLFINGTCTSLPSN
jgi:hypothetical protein